MRWFDTSDKDYNANFSTFMESRRIEGSDHVASSVSDIISDVRTRGDAALCDYTKRYDNLDLTANNMRITEHDMQQALEACPQAVRNALTCAAERIKVYHTHQLPKDWSFEDAHGNQLGMRWNAVDSAGIYVPGGKACYPSSVLMNALPARAAGVKRMVMVVPTPNGDINPAILVAASLCNITEIYRIGGAQAVAALAYGTETIKKVDVIAGPGNMYVAEAKRQVFGTVGIDMIAGPSEIAIVADGSVDPSWIAADLLSQAEHDEMAQSILITDNVRYAKDVEKSIKKHLETLRRKDIAEASLNQFGAIIVTKDAHDSCEVANIVAAEHLELAVENTDFYKNHIRHAGALFIGAYTPEAIGDYVAGPSHVLPTTQSARFASGLSVYQFMKKTSLIECSQSGFQALAEATEILAECEGLGAHKLSATLRKT